MTERSVYDGCDECVKLGFLDERLLMIDRGEGWNL